MSWLLAAALIVAVSEPYTVESAAVPAADRIAADLPTGSLLFSQGDCLAVKVFTFSPYTHVGTVVERDGKHFVYDSTGGAGVRTRQLADYLVSQGSATVFVYRAERPWSKEQTQRFERHLESQLGRPYAIRHHLTGERCDGLHCAEYATDALMAANVIRAERPPRVSPASLKDGIEAEKLYRHIGTLHLQPDEPQAATDAGWCGRLWFDTKACTTNCYRKLRGWFCCK